MEGAPKLQCFFLRETDKYSGLCEQERYRDGALMRGLTKSSASCHALILRGAEESFYRRFGSLFGLGVGIRKRNKKLFPHSLQDDFVKLLNDSTAKDFFESSSLQKFWWQW